MNLDRDRFFLIIAFLFLGACAAEHDDFVDASLTEIPDAAFGLQLYENRCASCHANIDSSQKLNRSTDQISNAISSVAPMQFLQLERREIEAIAYVLAGNRPGQIATCDGLDSTKRSIVKRLSKNQIINSINDIFENINQGQVSAIRNNFSNLLPDDVGEFSRTDNAIDIFFMRGYYRASELAADRVETNGSVINETLQDYINRNPGSCSSLNPNSPSSDCMRVFIENFGKRLFKRPLTTEETTAFRSIYESESNHNSGMSNVIFSFLVSPEFLFHIDKADIPVADRTDIVHLDSYEIAKKLSYRIWDSLPNQTLLDMARDNDLSEDSNFNDALTYVTSQTDKVRDSMQNFAQEWIGISDQNEVSIPGAFWDADVRALAARNGVTIPYNQAYIELAHLRTAMIDEIMEFTAYHFDQNNPFSSLFTSDISFARNQYLMSIYNVNTPAQNPVTPANAVRFPAGTRSGILTRSAIIGDSSLYANPIHRSIKVREKFLCMIVSEPPPDLNAEDLIPPQPDPNLTIREQYIAKTAPDNCMLCHEQINPYGFIMGKYDGYGGFHDTEIAEFQDAGGGEREPASFLNVDDQVDFTGQLAGAGVINGPIEFSTLVGQSEEARNCFAKKYVSHFNGQTAIPSLDSCQINALSTSLANTGFRDAVYSLFQAESFRYRRIEN